MGGNRMIGMRVRPSRLILVARDARMGPGMVRGELRVGLLLRLEGGDGSKIKMMMDRRATPRMLR